MILGAEGETTDVPTFVLEKNNGVRAVTGITSLLSILGSCLIIFSYIFFRDIRTRARLILLHLSLTDLGVGLCNFVGDVANFDQYYVNGTSTLVQNPPVDVDVLCKAQAFLALYFTISSILWTCVLAVYMYFLVVEKGGFIAKWYVWTSSLLCYGIPLLIAVWMIEAKRLGFSPYNSSGFCSVIVKRVPNIMISPSELIYKELQAGDLYVAVFAYDLWIVTTTVLTAVVYFSTHFFIRQEKAIRRISRRTGYSNALFTVEFKFLLIPMLFIILRIWSFFNNLLFVYIGYTSAPAWITKSLNYLTGIGDSGQGAVNGFIFVLLTKDVRKRLRSCACLRRHTSINDKSSASSDFLQYDHHSPSLTSKSGKTAPISAQSRAKKKQVVQESPTAYTPISSYEEG